MNILGIDTTTKTASVAVKTNDNIYTNSDINDITHSEKLLPLIHKTLKESNITLDDISILATTNGPGSFTGCRIGVATIKALSHYNKTNILAVSSLELIAFKTYMDTKNEYICSILDAKNNRVYYCVYKFEEKNNKINIKNIDKISNDDITNVLDKISKYKSCLFTGDCIDKFSEIISKYSFDNNLNYICVDNNNITPKAKYLIQYYENVDENILSKNIYNTFNLDVVYARVTQAERLKNEKQ